MKRHEPVVKKKSASYSILFLRDDSKVVRFRLSPAWMKFLVLVFILFSGTSGAAGYSAHYYWKRYTSLKLEYNGLETRLGENSRKLAAYSGVELIKEASSLPRSTMAGVSSIATSSNNGKPGGEGDAASATPETQNGSADRQTQGAPAETPAVSSGPVSGSAAGAATAQPADAASGRTGVDGAESEEHPALISEVQIRSTGNKSFRLTFDLSNRVQQLTLNGRVNVVIATKDGKSHEISQVNRDSLRFSINRYKRVVTNFALPADIQPDDMDRVLLTVATEDQPSVTYAFPVPTPF